jgi:hypothetical protein
MKPAYYLLIVIKEHQKPSIHSDPDPEGTGNLPRSDGVSSASAPFSAQHRDPERSLLYIAYLRSHTGLCVGGCSLLEGTESVGYSCQFFLILGCVSCTFYSYCWELHAEKEKKVGWSMTTWQIVRFALEFSFFLCHDQYMPHPEKGHSFPLKEWFCAIYTFFEVILGYIVPLDYVKSILSTRNSCFVLMEVCPQVILHGSLVPLWWWESFETIKRLHLLRWFGHWGCCPQKKWNNVFWVPLWILVSTCDPSSDPAMMQCTMMPNK